MATVARQVKRLAGQLAETRAANLDYQKHIGNLTKDLKEARKREERLANEVSNERLLRVSAQRGLVAYVEQIPCPGCGKRWVELGEKIGYDPDKDPKVLQEITEGKIPPHRRLLDAREIFAEVIAGRTLS